MIRATIIQSGIRIWADVESALVAAKLPGAARTPKMPIRQWNMPATLESISVLRGINASFTPELESEAKRIERVHEFVEQQKTATTVAPIAEIPLKPECQLYQHQVRALNIALAIYGYPLPGSPNKD